MTQMAIRVCRRAMVCALAVLMGGATLPLCAQTAPLRIEKNVVYGMYSGLALLLDVHRPERANGSAVLFVPGSGWFAAPDAAPLKNEPDQLPFFIPSLLNAGYTVFVINHRAAPEFHFPLPLEDAARAVRHIRHHASQYGVDPDRIGAVGFSSGANLVALLATNSKAAQADGDDAVGRESARIRCAVVVSTPVDLCSPTLPQGEQLVAMYLGAPPSCEAGHLPKSGAVADASPAAHVTADAAPTLFVHGTADPLVPIASTRKMAAALSGAGVPAKFVSIEGAGHWPLLAPSGVGPQEEIVGWLDRYLAPKRASGMQ